MVPLKRITLLSLLAFVSVTSFAQFSDTTIIAKSETIELKYSPKSPVTKTRITFFKFKETFGVQFLFLTPNKYIPYIFIESIDSLVLYLVDDKKVILNKSCPDTKFNEIPNIHIFQLSYFIDKAQFEELRKDKIIKINTTYGGRPLALQIKKESQKEILGVAAAF